MTTLSSDLSEVPSEDIPPAASAKHKPTDGPKLYEKIAELGLVRKLTDIALAETKVPYTLRDDAMQEIHTAWASYTADTSLSAGQIASYANMIAHHACLRIRRELGLPVRLPGSAFRKKDDGNTSVDLRRFVDPLSWDEITERLVGRQESQRDDAEGWEHLLTYGGEDPDQHLTHEDMQRVDAVYARVTPRQKEILEHLRRGLSFTELPEILGLSASAIQREVSALRRDTALNA